MFYKLNLFLREWEWYDKVYNFFDDNFDVIMIIKQALYMITVFLCFFNHSILLSFLRVVLFLIIAVIEYFRSCISREQNDKLDSYFSCFLMILALVVVVLYLSKLIFGF